MGLVDLHIYEERFFMTLQDPFSDAPAEEAQTAPETTTALQETVGNLTNAAFVAPSEGKVVVTLKGDGQPPWIVIHAEDTADALSQFDDSLAELMTKAQKATKHFASIERPARQSGSPGRELQPGQPAGSVQPPSWAPPMPDGYMYKSGEKNGNVWHAYWPIDSLSGLEKIWLKQPR